MYKFVLLVLLIAASCGTQNNKATTSTDTSEIASAMQNGEITLALGEAINLGDLVVQFTEVLEDSRCPTGTECFWEGRARLMVETSGDGMTVEKNEVIFGKLKPGEKHNHTLYDSSSKTVTATAINPYPTAESGTTGLAYELVLTIAAE